MEKFLIIVLLIVFWPITIPCGIIYLVFTMLIDGIAGASLGISNLKNAKNKDTEARENFNKSMDENWSNPRIQDSIMKSYAHKLSILRYQPIVLITCLISFLGIPALFGFVLVEPIKLITDSSLVFAILTLGSMGVPFYVINKKMKTFEKESYADIRERYGLSYMYKYISYEEEKYGIDFAKSKIDEFTEFYSLDEYFNWIEKVYGVEKANQSRKNYNYCNEFVVSEIPKPILNKNDNLSNELEHIELEKTEKKVELEKKNLENQKELNHLKKENKIENRKANDNFFKAAIATVACYILNFLVIISAIGLSSIIFFNGSLPGDNIFNAVGLVSMILAYPLQRYIRFNEIIFMKNNKNK